MLEWKKKEKHGVGVEISESSLGAIEIAMVQVKVEGSRTLCCMASLARQKIK